MQMSNEKDFENENFYLKEEITEKEINAISWKTGWFMHINNNLRYAENEIEFDREISEKIEILDNALKKSKLSKDMVLYRNLKLEHLLEANNLKLLNLHRNKVLIDKGYMEASPLRLGKMYDNDTQLILKVKKNTNCICVAAYTHRDYEMGILFPRKTEFKILKVRRYFWGKWKWKIYCEII